MTHHLAFTLAPGNYRWGAIHIPPPYVDKRHWRIIGAEIASSYGFQLDELIAQDRRPPLVLARQHVMAYLKKHGRTYAEISRYLCRDWATVCHGAQAHERRAG